MKKHNEHQYPQSYSPLGLALRRARFLLDIGLTKSPPCLTLAYSNCRVAPPAVSTASLAR